jgi:hypothetical protein
MFQQSVSLHPDAEVGISRFQRIGKIVIKLIYFDFLHLELFN